MRVKETAHIKSHSKKEIVERLQKINPEMAAKVAAEPDTPDFDVDSVTAYMADWLEQPELSVRSRLREWYLPANLKTGSQRGGQTGVTLRTPLDHE